VATLARECSKVNSLKGLGNTSVKSIEWKERTYVVRRVITSGKDRQGHEDDIRDGHINSAQTPPIRSPIDVGSTSVFFVLTC
jgi:hypothetical protein